MKELQVQLHCLYGGGYASNCYLLSSGEHAIVIDPSLSLRDACRALGTPLPHIDRIVLTHAHFDHILYLAEWRQQTGAPLAMHEYEAHALSDPSKTAFWQFLGRSDVFAPPEILLREGSVLTLGEEEIRVLHTPGHTVGSICLLADGAIITGDTVFTDGGFGRTDLYSGDEHALFASIKRLTALDVEGKMYPGHGPSGDFRSEMRCFMRY